MEQVFAFDQVSIQRMQGVDQKLITVAMRAQKIASKADKGYALTIPNYGGARTDEDQAQMFKNKVSKADGIKNKSYHQKSKYADGIVKALDVIPVILKEGKKGNQIYAPETTNAERDAAFAFVSACMLQAASELSVRLQWGGNWKFVDKPHYQMVF